MASSIGTRIKELRKKINISQEDLANELYVSRQTISKWESDIVSPDIKNIEMISKYFDVSADYLINGKENGKIAKQNNIWIFICLFVGVIIIVGTSILLIMNKGNVSPSSTINFSYEIVLMIIGLLFVFGAIIYLFKRKK
ncbi:MAG: helix-turn-helix transcriptional regulator [Bacilli bacterium]|nr:helix-turn-helix transcriptional regulator [Bacilli bacterium]